MNGRLNSGIFRKLLLLNAVLGIFPVIVISALTAFPDLVPPEFVVLAMRILLIALPVASIALAAMGAQSVTNAFNRLQYAHRRFRTGDLSYRIPLEGDADSVNLFRGFNVMADLNQENWVARMHEEREKAVARVAVQVAHDIRSPLTALAVAEGRLDETPDSAKALIRGATARIKEIAEELLKTHRDKFPVETPVTSLTELVNEIVQEKRLEIGASSRVEIEFSRPEPPEICARAKLDSGEFRRVLSNLLNNAIEATPVNGRVTVRLFVDDERTKVVVEDKGKGIPANVLSRVGERGFSFGKPGGSGLGVFHARSCCESWGGSLSLWSELNQGTKVEISLPLGSPRNG